MGVIRPAHISAVLAGLMWVLPFLSNRHPFPLANFYQEWGAFILGLSAMFLLASQRYWQQPTTPRIVLLPIGMMLLVLIQFMLGKVVYLDQVLQHTLYMLWAALLIVLGQHLCKELGLPALVTAQAIFLLLGAELNALISVLQHYSLHTFLDAIVSPPVNSVVVGNMAQPNHLANLITLGLISLGLLHTRWRLRLWQTVVLAAPLLFVLTLSGSRSPWLYLLCMVVMALFWQHRDKPSLPLLHYSLLMLLGFGLMHWIVQLPWLEVSSSSMTSGERLLVEVIDITKDGTDSGKGGFGIRLYLWREAWLIFTKFPLLGVGYGQFAWQHFQLGSELHNTNITGLYTNAHNLVMQVAAEMGLAGLLILIGTLTLWLWQARSVQRSIYHWWGYALLAVLAINGLLEFPLWYAYFLGAAALTLGMLDNTTYRLGLHSAGRLSVMVMLMLGLLTLLQVLQGYNNLVDTVRVIRMKPSPASDDYYQHVRNDLGKLQGMQGFLLRPFVEIFLEESSGWNHIADKGTLNDRVMHFVPIKNAVYLRALLLARAEQQAEARVQIERAIWAYPEDFPENLEKLRALADKDINPARFPALLEFALQKYEERQRAAFTNH